MARVAELAEKLQFRGPSRDAGGEVGASGDGAAVLMLASSESSSALLDVVPTWRPSARALPATSARHPGRFAARRTMRPNVTTSLAREREFGWAVGVRIGALLLVSAVLPPPAFAARPVEAPRLAAPDPGVFSIVHVATAQELADACWNLVSNRAIVVAPGIYDLAAVSFPNGVDGRLTVGRFGAPPISNIQIRGATGRPEDVVIHGAGMLAPIVPFGFQIFTATDVLIADLTIGEVYYHAVAIQGDQGAKRVRLYHVRAFDAGQQIVKASGAGADDVTIEFSEIFYTDGAIEHPEGSPPGSCYTNGIDGLGVAGWIVRDNLVRGIRCANGALAGPALLLWQGSSGSLIEGNTFLDCSRGVHLGLGPGDHSGGLVRNNFFAWTEDADYLVDVAIYTVSPGSKILHNTALVTDQYPNAIEVRFASTTGVEVRNNLLDGAVQPRDGAVPATSGNLTTAAPSWFLDAAAGDLRLRPTATLAIDQVTRHAEAPGDFFGWLRPATPGLADLGAAEAERIFTDGFESGATAVWSAVAP